MVEAVEVVAPSETMARRVFFSFHHRNDSWRAGQVRNCWLTQGQANSFVDAAAWEKVKRSGDVAVKAWIDRELKGTSVTVVLIGQRTWKRRWVKYEILQSYKRNNGILGIYVHGMKDERQQTSSRGRNPMADIEVTTEHSFLGLFRYQSKENLSDICPTYYWLDDDGRNNLTSWIEKAAASVGR